MISSKTISKLKGSVVRRDPLPADEADVRSAGARVTSCALYQCVSSSLNLTLYHCNSGDMCSGRLLLGPSSLTMVPRCPA